MEDRGFWTFLALFILLPLVVVLGLAAAGAKGVLAVTLYLLAFAWLGTGVIVGSGYVSGEP